MFPNHRLNLVGISGEKCWGASYIAFGQLPYHRDKPSALPLVDPIFPLHFRAPFRDCSAKLEETMLRSAYDVVLEHEFGFGFGFDLYLSPSRLKSRRQGLSVVLNSCQRLRAKISGFSVNRTHLIRKWIKLKNSVHIEIVSGWSCLTIHLHSLLSKPFHVIALASHLAHNWL